MAYTPINPLWIVPGQPTKTELFERISDNLDDHESRITTVETVTNVTQKIDFEIFGDYAYYNQVWPPMSPATGPDLDLRVGIMYERIPVGITALACRIIQYRAGNSGTTTFDLKYASSPSGTYNTIFSTLPSITAAAGDFAISSNAVLSVTSFPANTVFRLDMVTCQNRIKFDTRIVLTLEYEVA